MLCCSRPPAFAYIRTSYYDSWGSVFNIDSSAKGIVGHALTCVKLGLSTLHFYKLIVTCSITCKMLWWCHGLRIMWAILRSDKGFVLVTKEWLNEILRIAGTLRGLWFILLIHPCTVICTWVSRGKWNFAQVWCFSKIITMEQVKECVLQDIRSTSWSAVHTLDTLLKRDEEWRVCCWRVLKSGGCAAEVKPKLTVICCWCIL